MSMKLSKVYKNKSWIGACKRFLQGVGTHNALANEKGRTICANRNQSETERNYK